MRVVKVLLAAVLIAVFFAAGGGVGEAHKPTVTKFTYLEDIYPIFRDRCGSCHRPGGMAPMSLLSYRDAYPWAASIKNEVLELQMPPWYAEERYGLYKHSAGLTPRELNTIVDWCLGGTPEGEAGAAPSEEHAGGWKNGEPDLVVEMEAPFELDAATTETTRSFVFASGLTEPRSLRGVDLIPSSPNIVRSATLLLDTSGRAREHQDSEAGPGFADEGALELERVLAVWLPEQDQDWGEDVGITLPAGADLVLRLHYKKTWLDDGSPVSDRSRVGLYFHAGSAIALESFVLRSSHELETDSRLVAILPQLGGDALARLYAQAVRPDGTIVPLLGLHRPRPDWPRRYWLQAPLDLPKGTRIELQTLTLEGEPSPTAHLLLDLVQ